MNTTEQPETMARNTATVQAPSKQIVGASAAPPPPRTNTRLPVNNLRYWEGRLYRESYVRDGQRMEVPEYYVKLNHAGKRRAFNLGTANKATAAEKAREIALHLTKFDWQATIDKYAPSAAQTKLAPTLGDFLTEVQRTANLKPRTFHRYAQYLRQIIAHVTGIADNKGARYNYRTGGHAEWTASVDRAPLDELTPETAADWKADYLTRAGKDPLARQRTARSFNAALRSAKSLFADGIIKADNFKVRVPRFKIPDSQAGEREVYWFEKLHFEQAGSMKFEAPQGITPETLILAARRELQESDPDAYLLLLLCLCAGLRRTEADVLLWRQVHCGETAADNYIEIEVNQYHQPKHDSGGRVYIQSELARAILNFKARSQTEFVVNSPREWKRAGTYYRYRCAPHWSTLNAWLVKKGITDRKPIHTLRKLFGDSLTKTAGIYAAAGQLRHSTVKMTEKHYSDPRQQSPLKIAHLLTDQPIKSAQDAIADEIIARLAELSPAGVAKVLAAIKKRPAARKTRASGKVIRLKQAA